MKKILIDTALMMGITFMVGFAVAALIKLVTFILYYFQDHTLQDFFITWRRNNRARALRSARTHGVSEKVKNNANSEVLA